MLCTFNCYTVLIPAYNEAENIAPLLFEIQEVMELVKEPWEVIVVDDASTDGTWQQLEFTQERIPNLRAFRHTKQSGQSNALETGIQYAKGEIIITLDGDGQNDPHDIPKLLEKMEGVDCVSGCRIARKDTWLKRTYSKFANSIRRAFLHDGITDTGCSLKAFRKQALRQLKFYKGMHRFLPALLQIEGYKVIEVPVSHRPRLHGTSKYNIFNRGINTLADLFAVWWMKQRRILTQVESQLEPDQTSVESQENHGLENNP